MCTCQIEDVHEFLFCQRKAQHIFKHVTFNIAIVSLPLLLDDLLYFQVSSMPMGIIHYVLLEGKHIQLDLRRIS